MDQFIYNLKVTRVEMLTEGPTDDEKQVVSDHFSYLQAATEGGVVLLAGRTATHDPGTFGIVVFLAPDEGAAMEFMKSDPAVAGGVMTGELWPFRIALMGQKPEQ